MVLGLSPVSATKILLTRKLEIATDVNTFLLGEFINWFLYSISKSWRTYTLSYHRDKRKRSYYGLCSDHDSVLKENGQVGH